MTTGTLSTTLWSAPTGDGTLSTDSWVFSTFVLPDVNFHTDYWAVPSFTDLITGTLSSDYWVIFLGINRMYNIGTNGKITVAPVLGTTNTPVLDGSGVTAVRTYVLPDASGTIQLAGGFADAETPSGTVNGSNVTFTLAHTPSPAASLQLFVNGVLQQAGGIDYTLSGLTITFVTAPATSSILLAYYRYS